MGNHQVATGRHAPPQRGDDAFWLVLIGHEMKNRGAQEGSRFG
jgi:hypothetical protein